MSFELNLPCQPQILLGAIADYSGLVFNNVHSNPKLVTTVGSISQVSWLQTDSITVALHDLRNGHVTHNPPYLAQMHVLSYLLEYEIADAPTLLILQLSSI